MRFRDIPMFTEGGAWECDFGLDDAIEFVRKDHGSPLNMNPDFQRDHVWTEGQQIAWIEFFLRGGKTGRVLYFNHPGWMRGWEGEFVVVDGKQRLRAVERFIENEIKAFGHYFREYTDRMRLHHTIRINVNTLQTRAEVLQWYIEMNAGGTPHTQREIEKVRKLLKKEPTQ